METKRKWSFEKDEMLIELVRYRRGLYDLQSPHYSDNNYKRIMWDEIGKVVGQPDAKIRWESLRSQYRKYLGKLKTKSGEAGTKISKWRFHDQMAFLNEFLNVDRPRVSSIHEETSNENLQDADDMERESETILSQRTNNDYQDVEDGNKSVNTLTSMIHKTKNEASNVQEENESSILMKYILGKQRQECAPHPIDNFFSLMAATVKQFSAIDQHFVKTKVFTLVNEIEGKYLTQSSSTFSPLASVQHFQTSPVSSLYSTASTNVSKIIQSHSQDTSRYCLTPISQPTYSQDNGTTLQPFNSNARNDCSPHMSPQDQL